MAGIEPTQSKSNDWTTPSPCQLGQGGWILACPPHTPAIAVYHWSGCLVAETQYVPEQAAKIEQMTILDNCVGEVFPGVDKQCQAHLSLMMMVLPHSMSDLLFS